MMVPRPPVYQRLIYLRDLLWQLVGRDLKLRYRGSLLGVAWSLLNPLAQLLVFSFVFRFVLPLNIANYTSFLFIGLLAWAWFQSSLQGAATAVVDGRSLIRRPGFPAAILPVITVTANLVHFLLALPVLWLFLWLTGVQLTAAVAWLPLIVALQFVLTLGLAYFVATLHVAFRDTQHLVGVFLFLLFYLTPVFYNAAAIPAVYQPYYRLNPILHLLTAYRAILLEGTAPPLAPLFWLGLLSTGLLLFGQAFLRRASDHFVEEL